MEPTPDKPRADDIPPVADAASRGTASKSELPQTPVEAPSDAPSNDAGPPKAYRDAYARSLLPLQNHWFDREPKYVGVGTAHFSSPKGTVTGTGEISFDKGGRATAVLNYTEYDSTEIPDLTHTDFIMGRREKNGGINDTTRPNPCERFRLEGKHGTFESFEKSGEVPTAGRTLLIGGSGTGEPVSIPLKFPYLQGVYRPKRDVGVAKYWVLPLANFIGQPVNVFDDLEEHPLRLRYRPKLPPWLTDDDTIHLRWNSRWTNSTIAFEYKGKPIFIELLDDYKERKQELLDRNLKSCVTAVMVGELDGDPPPLGQEGQWEFVRLLGAVGAIVGAEVYAPWLELRDESGRLVERRHLRFSKPEFRQGRHIIDEWYCPNTAHFLWRVLDSGLLEDEQVRVLFDLIRAAGERELLLEERLVLVFRQLDLLCQKYGTRSAWKPKDTLRPEHAAEIYAAIADCRQKIRDLAQRERETYGPEELRRFDLVSNRVSDAATLHSSYGGAVLALFERFGIDDLVQIEAHLKSISPSGRVPKLLESLRGSVVHGGYLARTDESPYSWEDVHALADHLHDICVRIMFAIVGYEGPYTRGPAHLSEAKIKWPSAQRILESFGYVEVAEWQPPSKQPQDGQAEKPVETPSKPAAAPPTDDTVSKT